MRRKKFCEILNTPIGIKLLLVSYFPELTVLLKHFLTFGWPVTFARAKVSSVNFVERKSP